MKMQVRIGLVLMLALAALGLSSCDHYVCGANFGNSTCTGGATTLSQSGGGSTSAAFVFAVDSNNGGANGSIDGFTIDTTNNTFQATTSYTAPTVPANNGGVGMAVAQKQFLYAAFGNGQLFGWTISSTGSLTSVAGSPFAAPFLADYVIAVGEAYMITNPAGTYLYVSAQSANQIYGFQIGSSGVLTAITGSPFSAVFPLGGGPNNLAIDGLGKYLYASNGDAVTHTAGQILTYSIGATGTLTPVGSALNSSMWLLKGEPTGAYMIGTTGHSASVAGVSDDDHLYVFSIGSNGALSLTSTETTVYSPWSIAAQSNSGGNLVYSFSFNDTDTAFNPPEGFSIQTGGSLQLLSGSPFSGLTNGSWGQFDQSGLLLLDWASYFDPNTNATVTTLSPFNVGSGGALTQPISTLTLNNPGFWVVTDPQ